MANRQRMIKPDFWIDEKLGDMPRDTRLLYIGLWGVADDEYRFEYSLARIRAMLFPYDTLSEADMVAMIQPLIDSGRVVVYESGGKFYGFIPRMGIHQKIDHATASKLPAPDGEFMSPQEVSRGFAKVREGSLPIELNVIQSKPIEDNSPPAKPTRSKAGKIDATAEAPPDGYTAYGYEGWVWLSEAEHVSALKDFGASRLEDSIHILAVQNGRNGQHYVNKLGTKVTDSFALRGWVQVEYAKRTNGKGEHSNESGAAFEALMASKKPKEEPALL